MELKRKKDVASVALFEVIVSESELEIFDRALTYVLEKRRVRECLKQTGATRDEIEGIQEDIRNILQSVREAIEFETRTRYPAKGKTGTEG